MSSLQDRIVPQLLSPIPSLSSSLTNSTRMRKKRPSYSPIKNEIQTPPGRGFSSNPTTSQKPEIDISSTEKNILNTGLASLQFQEFSWTDDKGGYKGVSAKDFGRLNDYMISLYPEILSIEERTPYLVIWCEGSTPEPAKRPFLIAGLLGVWLVNGPNNLPREFISGFLGNLTTVLKLNEDLAADIREYHIPRTENLCLLMYRFFPDALAVSYIDNGVSVELPQMSAEDHVKRLDKLPYRFWHEGPSLLYFNGLRAMWQEHKRSKKPKPETIDGDFDDTDYVATQGCFYPGSMISNTSGDSVSAGVLVRKGDDRRLTLPIHCWKDELKKIPEKLGDPLHFRAIQGKTDVGYISKRLGSSDIGLLTLNDDIEFRNQFMDIPGEPSRLIHSNSLKMDNVYVIDSFTTGYQAGMLCKGKRVISLKDKAKRTDDTLKGNQKDLPGAGTYMVLVQGVFLVLWAQKCLCLQKHLLGLTSFSVLD